jgi:hypothetical protein
MEWMRRSELFSGKFITVWDYNQSVRISGGTLGLSSLFPTCLNSIKHNTFMLEKVFESQKFNSQGIYFVKIAQSSSWKYVIVDDYIPVIRQDKKCFPAFLNVQSSNANHVQIWPFLLQKAYAKYYSNYECLQLGNELDFLQEITGSLPDLLNTASPSQFEQLCHEANSYDSILLAKGSNNKFYPLVPHKPLLTCEDPDHAYAEKCFTNEEFRERFEKVYCVLLHKYLYSGSCTIKFNHGSFSDGHISLRCINVEEATQCAITLTQKDARHYYKSEYAYIWVRVLVVMKESEHNYRWIGGVYRNTKYASLNLWLEPGEYTVIIMPEWRGKGFDLGLTFQCNFKTKI